MAEKIYWITPEGGTLDLTDGVRYMVRQGIDGRHMPAFTYASDKMFTFPGEVLRGITTDKREIILPIKVAGTDADDFRNNQRFLEYSLDPMRGEGKLKVVTDDAVPMIRLMNCHYQGGMSFVESGDTGNYKTRIYGLQFICHSPYWYDPLEIKKWFPDPQLFMLMPQVIYNDGDVDTWPILEIAGPLQSITVNNETNSKFLKWGIPGTNMLASNVKLYIDCRPGYRNCCISHYNGGYQNANPIAYGNVFRWLDSTSFINFNFVPGENRISFLVTQASYNAGAAVTVHWVNRYNGI
jgi:hypothetical protein